MDYINPFSAMSGDATISSPFLRDFDRGNRQIQAMPFIDMAKQQQQMELQKKQTELSEFQSPLAAQVRQSGLQNQLTTNQNQMRLTPWKTDAEIADAKQRIELSPVITNEKKLQAQELARKIQGTPMVNFFNGIASINQAIKAMPPEARALAAPRYVEMFKSQNPGVPLPPEFAQYDPVKWDLAELIAVNTAEVQAKSRLQKEEDAAKMAREKEQTSRSIQVAEIGANSRAVAAQTAADSRGDKPLDPAKEFVRLNNALQSTSTQAEREEIVNQMKLLKPVQDAVKARMETAFLNKSERNKTFSQIEQEVLQSLITGSSQGGTPSPSGNSLQQAARSAGWAWEPDKYEYKIINGKIARKPK